MAEQPNDSKLGNENELPKTSKLSEDEYNSDSGITMLDVLEEEESLETDANAVLGGSDDQVCAYIDGYAKRQALYACKTCTVENESAGICLACSYACHENHDLYELYTKRNFRCDCGNSKFKNNTCSLWKGKQSINQDNHYNQNFKGKYCTCARPYPDPEDDVPDQMIQCIICEDWYHGRHLGESVPSNDDFSELICHICMDKCSFLRRYYVSTIATKVNNESKEGDISVGEVSDQVPEKHNSELNSSETFTPDDENLQTGKECLLKTLPKVDQTHGACFWPEGWRTKLCKCEDCLKLYEDNQCMYLLDPEDTVHAYEERGKLKLNNGESQYDRGLSALNTLDRVQQVEAIHEYNNMKTKLKDYLKTFAESKKVVTENDIHEFFNTMQARKRQRTSYHMPHFCR